MAPGRSQVTERRYDPVTGEWRMFAGHRQGRTFLPPEEFCPLCPTRPGHPPTEIPLPAFDVVVFENRFPALVRDPPEPAVNGSSIYAVAPSAGANEVVVYSDDHHLGLVDMDAARIARIVEVWADRYAELGGREEVAYVFIFENRGVAVGVTLHHPHGQIYAYPETPPDSRTRSTSRRSATSPASSTSPIPSAWRWPGSSGTYSEGTTGCSTSHFLT